MTVPRHVRRVRVAVEVVGARGQRVDLVVAGRLGEPLVARLEHRRDREHGDGARQRHPHGHAEQPVELAQLGALRLAEPTGVGEEGRGRDEDAEQQHERARVIRDGEEREQAEEHRQTHQVRPA